MVDWATQDRLYPSGYQQVNIRYRRISIDSSLPYSVTTNKRHNCCSQTKQIKRFNNENLFIDNLHGLNQSIYFYNDYCDNLSNERRPKLIATYASNINWPRSVCCLSETDGSFIVCEEDQCRLLLFSSQLMLRSSCGGIRGNGSYEFDSPWSVASLFDNSSSNILVADTNNRRIQIFSIEYNGQFLYKKTLITKEKPFSIATNQQHFAVSCEKGFICTFLAKKTVKIANINLNKISSIQITNQIAFCLCLNPENSHVFLSNPIALTNIIYELSITGEYVRSIKLDYQPFLHISSLIIDVQNHQLIIADSLNSIIYSVNYDLNEENVEILFKRSDNINYPQSLCISNEGHLIVVECSVFTQHALKVFRYHPCLCHSRIRTSSVKTSETTSVRSIYV